MTIDEILRDQDGLITRRQAAEAGLTPARIAHRLSSEAWLRVRPSVFRSAEHPETDRGRMSADALWLGDGAALIGLGTAWWLRLTDEPPARPRFAVPVVRRVRSTPSTGIVRRDLDDAEGVLVEGVRVTTRPVTVLDAVAELGCSAGADLMDRALLRGRVSPESLREAHWSSLGRWGSRASGDALCLAASGARFAAERRLHRHPTDPMGKMFFNILATFAEFEVDLLRMRTREGMAVAKAKGKLRGRAPKLNARQHRELHRMHDTGDYTIADLTELFSISRPTVYRALERSRPVT